METTIRQQQNDSPMMPQQRSEKSGDSRPMEVKVEGDNINRAINQLKRKMANEGIYKELKKRRFYEKPSERKKRKAREAERRLRKAMRRQAKAKAKGRG